MPCTAPSRIARSPEMSDRYSDSSVVWRAECHRPRQRPVGSPAGHVLVHREAGVDPGPVDLSALQVQRPDRGTHALRAHRDDVHVGREFLAVLAQVAEQESVRQAEGGSRPQRREHVPVQLRLGGIGDQQDHHVGVADDLEHLAEAAIGLGESALARLVGRRAALPEPDDDLDGAAPCFRGSRCFPGIQRVPEVLRLGAALRPPADHADLPHALQRPGQHPEQVPPAAYDRLPAISDGDVLLLEDGRLKVQTLLRHGSFSHLRNGSLCLPLAELAPRRGAEGGRPTWAGTVRPEVRATVSRPQVILRTRSRHRNWLSAYHGDIIEGQ